MSGILGLLNPFTGPNSRARDINTTINQKRKEATAKQSLEKYAAVHSNITDSYKRWVDRMKDVRARKIVYSVKKFIAEFLAQPSREFAEDGRHTRDLHVFMTSTFRGMCKNDVWRGLEPSELEGTFESLERYVMVKLYTCLFPNSMAAQRKDDDLTRRLCVLQFVRSEHLDIPHAFMNGDVVERAGEELCRMDLFRAPCDKIISLLNCCKIIMDHLKCFRSPSSTPGSTSPVLNNSANKKKPIIVADDIQQQQQQEEVHNDNGGGEFKVEMWHLPSTNNDDTAAAAAVTVVTNNNDDDDDNDDADGLLSGVSEAIVNTPANKSTLPLSPPPLLPTDDTLPPPPSPLEQQQQQPGQKKRPNLHVTELDRPPSLDDFLPILIYILIKSRVPHLYLNSQYILHCRSPSQLKGEPWYYMTNLCSAISFIQNLDYTHLSIDGDEYARLVAAGEACLEEEERARVQQEEDAAAATEKTSEDESSVVAAAAAAAAAADEEAKEASLRQRLVFMQSRVMDLRFGDIPKLLSEYKRLASTLLTIQQRTPRTDDGHHLDVEDILAAVELPSSDETDAAVDLTKSVESLTLGGKDFWDSVY